MTEEKPEMAPQAENSSQAPAPQTPAQEAPATPQAGQPQAQGAQSFGEPQEVDMVAQANAFLQKPMVKKYVGGMGKMMIFFALLGCFAMIAAITAITSLFNMIIPK